MGHNKNTIGEEGNERPPHTIPLPYEDFETLTLASAKLGMEYAVQLFFRVDRRRQEGKLA